MAVDDAQLKIKSSSEPSIVMYYKNYTVWSVFSRGVMELRICTAVEYFYCMSVVGSGGALRSRSLRTLSNENYDELDVVQSLAFVDSRRNACTYTELPRRDWMRSIRDVPAAVGLVLLLVLNVESRAPLQIGIRDGYLKSMGYKDTWSAAKAIGIRAIEIDLNTDLSCKNLYEADSSGHSIANAAGIQKLKETLKSRKIEVSAFCTVIPIAGDMTPEQVQHWVAGTAAAAKELKVPIIMMPLIARGIEDREFIERAQQFVKPLERIAEDTGVQLTIENLGHYLNRKEILEPILKSFQVRHVGLALDICNMYWFGHPLPVLYELAEFFAPYVRYVHVKSVKYPEDQREKRRPEGWEYMKYAEPVPTGDLDFSRILKLYYRAGYRGPVTLEDDSLEKYQMPELRQVHIRDRQSLENIVQVLGRGN